MSSPSFRVNSLYWETQAHRKQKPALSYAKQRVIRVVSLGAKKLFFLLVFIFFGMVKISAQTKIKNTTNRVSKTVRRIIGTVMRGSNVNVGQSIVKRDTVMMVKVDTVYFPKFEGIEPGADSFLGIAKKALPTELMRLLIEGIIFLSLRLIWKNIKFYFYLLRRWIRRKSYKKSFL